MRQNGQKLEVGAQLRKIKVQIALIQVGQFITTRNKEQWYFVNGDYTLDKMLRCQHSHCYTLESDSDQVKQGCLKQSDKKISLQQNRRYMIMSFSKILKQLTRMERSFATQHKPENNNCWKMSLSDHVSSGQLKRVSTMTSDDRARPRI